MEQDNTTKMKNILAMVLDFCLILVCLCLISLFLFPEFAGRQTAKFKQGYECVTKEAK